MIRSKSPKPSTLSAALTAAFATFTAMTPFDSMADTEISGTQGSESWASGNLTVSKTGRIASWDGVLVIGTSVGTLTNRGTIVSAAVGVSGNTAPSSAMVALINEPGATITGGTEGVSNFGAIDTVLNSGFIYGGHTAFYTQGPISTLTNTAGAVIGSVESAVGIHIDRYGGAIDTLTNDGLVKGRGSAIRVGGAIAQLNNSGTVSSAGSAIFLEYGGNISTLTNSGTITGGSFAIKAANNASLSTLTNSGTIVGDISLIHPVSIAGAQGDAFGTLTGVKDLPATLSVSSPGEGVEFTSGNLRLNDNIVLSNGTVKNSGATLLLTTPIGIVGTYSQAAGATLQIGVSDTAVTHGNIQSDVGYGRLIVSGSAVIDANAAVTLRKMNVYPFAVGQRFVVVDAASQGTQYNEGALRYAIKDSPATVVGTAVPADDRKLLVLSITNMNAPTSPLANPPVTPSVNPPAAITGVTNYTGVSDPGLLNVFNATKALSGASINRAGAQMSPQVSASRAAAASTMDALNVVSTHIDQSRLNALTAPPACDSEPLRSVWGQALGGQSRQADAGLIDGYRANFGGVLLGFDCAINRRWRAGGVLTYTNTDITNTGYTNGSQTRVDALGLIGFGSYTADRWYANLSTGMAQQRYNTTRIIDFPGVSGTAYGAFGGTQLVARAEFGYPLAAGSLTVTPIVALTYGYLKQNAYTETAGNGAALSVGTTNTRSVTTDLAIKLSQPFASRYGAWIPELQVGWRHQYDNSQGLTFSQFSADPTGETAFSTAGSRPITDTALVTAGLTLVRSERTSLTLRYDLQAASGYVSQAGSLRLRQFF
ncbi:Outer membrane protein B [Pandoraea iniqua]|uniref:Outer membrane protein B n=1 Tax=Pandoraea iniqua TaxID=2508288 RepID=A0A5E4YDB7_9BURK|nr:autotransporter domain-containing protein [Pandoraea iniqua]VVE46460.1 Outer membrane protein B [Pandoraea iniqua]